MEEDKVSLEMFAMKKEMLKEGQLDTYITAKYAAKNREFFELWASFDEGIITVKQLLHSCDNVKV